MRKLRTNDQKGALRVGPVMAVLKSSREIELMRNAGHIVRQVLEVISELVKPGVNVMELSHTAEEMILRMGAEPLFKGVTSPAAKFPFPAVICTSINDQVVHGIPQDRILTDGDIISVDCGVRHKGYCGDAATTLAVGKLDDRAQQLLDVTSGALDLAMKEMQPGRLWSDVAGRIQSYVESVGFSVVREFVGHGIGQEMHEEPKVPNYTDQNQRKQDFRLEPGLVVAVEPMVNVGSREVKAGDSTGWPQVTKDGSLSAHFEHTIAITDDGIDVLTNR